MFGQLMEAIDEDYDALHHPRPALVEMEEQAPDSSPLYLRGRRRAPPKSWVRAAGSEQRRVLRQRA